MIPVEFAYKGKVFKGHLASVSGTGNKTYYLMVNKKYYGVLNLVEDKDTPHLSRNAITIKHKWKFTSKTGKLDYLESVFVEALKMAQLF